MVCANLMMCVGDKQARALRPTSGPLEGIFTPPSKKKAGAMKIPQLSHCPSSKRCTNRTLFFSLLSTPLATHFCVASALFLVRTLTINRVSNVFDTRRNSSQHLDHSKHQHARAPASTASHNVTSQISHPCTTTHLHLPKVWCWCSGCWSASCHGRC